MSVGIKGISKLNANSFKEITIKQVDTYDYIVDVFGDNVKRKNNIFSNQLKGMSNIDKIVAIIEKFLDNFKIDGITSLVELSDNEFFWVVVYGNNGNSVLRLQLFNSYFDKVFSKIKMKYSNDRYSFCWNDNIKSVRLSVDSDWSRYGIHLVDCDECKVEAECDYSNMECDKYMQLYLKLGTDRNVVAFEKKFIREFLFYKFDLVGEEVKVINVMTEYDNSLNRKFSKHIIKCGDFELEFPHQDELMFIFGIVNEYNRELFEINKNIKKRQLKMEGF